MSATKRKHNFTEDQIAEMRQMRLDGATWAKIARRFACAEETVHKAAEPAYAERRRRMDNRHQGKVGAVSSRVDADIVDRLVAQIPRDTRDLTGVVFGDPLPGRSALDRRRGA